MVSCSLYSALHSLKTVTALRAVYSALYIQWGAIWDSEFIRLFMIGCERDKRLIRLAVGPTSHTRRTYATEGQKGGSQRVCKYSAVSQQ